MSEKEPLILYPFNIDFMQGVVDWGCMVDDCEHDDEIIYIGPKCHPGAAVHFAISLKEGIAVIECAVCREPVIGLMPLDHPETERFDVGNKAH